MDDIELLKIGLGVVGALGVGWVNHRFRIRQIRLKREYEFTNATQNNTGGPVEIPQHLPTAPKVRLGGRIKGFFKKVLWGVLWFGVALALAITAQEMRGPTTDTTLRSIAQIGAIATFLFASYNAVAGLLFLLRGR